MQEKIVALLKTVKREGMDNLINYLEKECDFFTASASTTYHENTAGGLARHSYNVYTLLAEKVARFYPKGNIPEQSIVLCGLLHDVCKIDMYKWGFKWKKDANNKWIEDPCWLVDDKFPVGHGEKSVFMIQRYIQLTDEEIAAIRFHLGMSETGVHFNYPMGFAYKAAISKYPLLLLTHTADVEAAYALEETVHS